MEVKAGYKKTDMGVIPKDWETKTLGDVITHCFSGATPRRNRPDFYKGTVRWITSGELNYNVINDTAEKISVEAVKQTNLQILPKGTFLMAITGLEAEKTRGSCGVVGEPSTTNQSCMAVFPKDELLTEYLFHYYRFRGKYLAFQYCQGTKQQSYTAKLVKQLPIALPPTIKEQHAIAEALSDVDALIVALDVALAKKGNLKQATMQQLLTGQTRLPGFHGKWEVKRIGEFTDCAAGGTPSTRISEYWGGTIRWMNSGELNLKYVCEVEGRITEAGLNNSSTRMIPAKCVLIGLAGQGKTRGTVAMNLIELCTNQSIAAVFPNELFVPEYLYFNLDARYDELRELSAGDGGRGGLNLTIIKSILIPFPSMPEQAAIATVLSDMDAEIAALVARRDKTQALKQAMMQELLTGKTRLIPTGAANA